MTYPKMTPKSKLPLSAGHDVDRCPACSPEDYPPYERPPVRVVDRARAAVAFGVIVFILLLGSIQGVNAADPSGRCDACRINRATPRPTPVVVGLPLPTGAPVVLPARTLPPTDTLP